MEIGAVRAGVLLFSSLTTLAFAGCNNDPGKGKAVAAVASTEPSAAPEPGGVPYAFSNDGSELAFVGAKITRTHKGRFGSFRGVVTLIDGNPERSSVKVEIDLDSVSADDPKLTTHLKSPDFFHVEKFPRATFSSTSIKAGGPIGATHIITGNLDLHGASKSVVFPASIRVAGGSMEADAEFAIDRKEFGIVHPGAPDDLISDEVQIVLKIRAKR